MIDRLAKNNQALESRAGQLRSFGEIMRLGPAISHTTSLLRLGLQKACERIDDGRGWVLSLDGSRRRHFRVACEVATNDGCQSRERLETFIFKKKTVSLSKKIRNQRRQNRAIPDDKD